MRRGRPALSQPISQCKAVEKSEAGFEKGRRAAVITNIGGKAKHGGAEPRPRQTDRGRKTRSTPADNNRIHCHHPAFVTPPPSELKGERREVMRARASATVVV